MSNQGIEGLLLDELDRERKAARVTYIVVAILVLIVLIYTSWLGSRVKLMLDPEGLALAASGLAVDAAPDIADELEATLVDGAPDIAKWVSEQIISSIPAFRVYLEEQIGPVVDSAAAEMVEAAAISLSKKIKAGELQEGKETAELANAIVAEFELALEFALDDPDEQGETPRQRIEASLASMGDIDRELRLLARNRGLTPSEQKERELLIEWLEIIVHMEQGIDPAQVEAVEQPDPAQ